MKPKEVFEVWAPASSVWSPWVKPTLFAQLIPADADTALVETSEVAPPLGWVPTIGKRPALIVDLPGSQTLRVGTLLADCGYRPVSLFNGTRGPVPVVSMDQLMGSLLRETSHLQNKTLVQDAPPAFLLDSRRMQGELVAKPGTFDNRWLVFPQDFPSAGFLKDRGIEECFWVGRTDSAPGDDLSHVLLRWQEAGLRIRSVRLDEAAPEPTLFQVQPPSRFKVLWHRALALMGLHRNSAGGFGSLIPEARSGGYG